jgi:tripeptidyl-peptidase-1
LRRGADLAIFLHSPVTSKLLSIRRFTFTLDHNATSLILSSYFTKHNPPYKYYSSLNGTIGENDGIYNRIGRGFPDVAAVGQNGAMVYLGQNYIGGGTSMSAPVVAAIFTRINEERLASGKSTIGFVNPTLYANPQMFHDITAGDQSAGGCGTNGFSAVTGWDPVTGLGTPRYDAWLDVFMALP